MALCLLLIPFSAFADAEPTEWTDTTANVTFSVPAGWSRVSKAETDSVKYAFQKDGDEKQQFLGYSVIDLYEGRDESFKAAYKRSDVNNSMMTAEEFEKQIIGNADESGIKDPKVESKTVGEYDFFRLTFNQKINDDSSVNVVLYAHIVNGYSVYFRFQTYNGAPDEEDINAVISSVKFADEIKEEKTEPESSDAKEEKKEKDEKKSGIAGISRYWIVGGLALLSSILGIIIRKIRK